MNEEANATQDVSEVIRKSMRSNKGKNTRPELIVRKALREAGYPGYRLHWEKVPGKPDIAYPGRKIAIFVNGCFWHHHTGCKLSYTPKTNVDFWNNKFIDNVMRDLRNYTLLKEAGWQVFVIWECELAIPKAFDKITYAVQRQNE